MGRWRLKRGHAHVEFLLILSVICLVWGLGGRLLLDAIWHGSPPLWAKIVLVASCPVFLLIGLAVVVDGLFAIGYSIYKFIELPASLRKLAVWQYPKRKLFGVAQWLLSRAVLLAASIVLTYLMLGRNATWDDVLKLTTAQVFGIAGIVCAWIVGIVWLLAWLKWRRLKPIYIAHGRKTWPSICAEFEVQCHMWAYEKRLAEIDAKRAARERDIVDH